jgi:osmotically-inducible protein OsmY
MDITNDRIQDDVRAELAGDPRLPYADEIAVEAFGGAITLRGSPSDRHRGRGRPAMPARVP